MKTFTHTNNDGFDLVHMIGTKDDYVVTEANGTITYTSESLQRTYTVTGNEEINFKRPDNQGKVKFKWNEEFTPFDLKGTTFNPFTTTTEAFEQGAVEGLYFFKNSNNQTQELFYKDGWVMITSNNAKSSVIPSGTARNNLAYTVNRNGVLGHLGTPSPESDYIIGDFVSSFSFTQGRILGWGRGNTAGTYTVSPTENLGEYIDVQWNVSSFNTVTPRVNVTIFGNSSLSPNAAYFVLDSVKKDLSLNANANQSTIGGVGVQGADGDSSSGCYLGHGTTEGSFEGWYNSANGAANTQGYTTWIKS